MNNPFEQIEVQACQNSLYELLCSTYREFTFKWYHKLIADKVQQVIEGKIKKLMIFVPPQHQKSSISSRVAPAWAFGDNPNLRIVHCAYGVDLVEGFSRDIQRIIDSEFYSKCFPETNLSGKNVKTLNNNSYVRTVEKWEIVNKKGSYYCAGVLGGITGKSCDLGIIDDPVKGAQDANSETVRNRVWDWYLQDFRTRLHNDSRQIIIQTRWHSDDLSGRILQVENDWEVINLPAIKEDNMYPYDIRQIGDALYPELHSLERLLEIKQMSPRTFAALYQQSPTIAGGNIIKSEWFKKIPSAPVGRIDFFLDTAYTAKTSNDPTGIIATSYINGIIYILKAEKVRYEFPDLVKWLKGFVKENGYSSGSSIRIEPKANGLSLVQQLRSETKLNVIHLPSPRDDKQTRLSVSAPTIESGKVCLVNGSWIEEFTQEISQFPSSKHDEYVDLIAYAVDHYCNGNEFYLKRAN